MKPVSVIGLGLSPDDLTAAHLDIIRKADILVGGRRHLAFFQDSPARKKIIDKHIDSLTAFIREEAADKAVVVLASGDPLFHGIGTRLVTALGVENVRIYPNITSVSAAFSRIGESWHDARLLSLHSGPDMAELDHALMRESKIALLTSPDRSPVWIAQILLKRRITGFRMCVLEHLGTPDEQIRWFSPETAAETSFADPNVVILLRNLPPEKAEYPFYPGMPEENFAHENGLITKAEVRAVSLSKLRLHNPGHILWDLGAGSGSVGIEAGFFLRNGRIFAVEQHSERIEQIRRNRDRFGVWQMDVAEAVLPDGLADLPDPDRVFIGGGGKNLGDIIQAAAGRLRPGGVIVANTVLLQNIEPALNALRSAGLETEITQIQVSTGRAMPWGERLQAQNPVWIISGISISQE